MHVSNLFGFAFRSEVSNALAFQLGFIVFNQRAGFQFNVSFGGEQAQALQGENLLFLAIKTEKTIKEKLKK